MQLRNALMLVSQWVKHWGEHDEDLDLTGSFSRISVNSVDWFFGSMAPEHRFY